MTIAERKAKEAHDREHPWRPAGEAKADGMICELRSSDMAGIIEYGHSRFFLAQDGCWYRIDPPARAYFAATEYRPTGVVLSERRMESVIRKAEDRWETIGRDFVRKPKPYKLHWRADDAN